MHRDRVCNSSGLVEPGQENGDLGTMIRHWRGPLATERSWNRFTSSNENSRFSSCAMFAVAYVLSEPQPAAAVLGLLELTPPSPR